MYFKKTTYLCVFLLYLPISMVCKFSKMRSDPGQLGGTKNVVKLTHHNLITKWLQL